MNFIRIIVFVYLMLGSNIYAGWLDDQSDLTTEDVITPVESVDVQSEPVTIQDSGGWTGELGSEKIDEKVSQNKYLALINGKSFNAYVIEHIYMKSVVKEFYSRIGYRSYWFQNGLKIDSRIKSLLKAIEEAPTEALDKLQRYHYDEISIYISEIEDNSYNDSDTENLTATLDILLSDAFFNLAHDLYRGILDYNGFQAVIKERKKSLEINYKWDTPKAKLDYVDLLDRLYNSNSIKKGLYDLVNHSFIYERLKEVYQNYQDIEVTGGWEKIPDGKTLRYGSKGKRVQLLAKRLSITDDLTSYHEGYNTFDKALKIALKRYQKRMGLWVSGTLTAETRRSLNISVKAKLALIKLNIEKARWEISPMNGRFIFVNIPDFMFRFFDNNRVILANRVVVGKKKNPTPIFSSFMSYVVLNPTWTVPDSIVKKEMLHKFQEDPGYLAGKDFKIYDGWGKNRKVIDPYEVDWSKYNDKSKIPYVFVRGEGVKNPLGIVKFMFPNNNAVYIHDTPSKSLFKKRVRAFSHGCVRLHNPMTLLELLANENMSLGYKKVKSMLKTGKLKSVGLDKKVPVYIRYYTVYVKDNGIVKFSKDIYGYDKILIKYLLK